MTPEEFDKELKEMDARLGKSHAMFTTPPIMGSAEFIKAYEEALAKGFDREYELKQRSISPLRPRGFKLNVNTKHKKVRKH